MTHTFTVIAHIEPGHDMSEISFSILAESPEAAKRSAYKALGQLGFKEKNVPDIYVAGVK